MKGRFVNDHRIGSVVPVPKFHDVDVASGGIDPSHDFDFGLSIPPLTYKSVEDKSEVHWGNRGILLPRYDLGLHMRYRLGSLGNSHTALVIAEEEHRWCGDAVDGDQQGSLFKAVDQVEL